MKIQRIKCIGGPLHDTFEKCTNDVDFYTYIDSEGKEYSYDKKFYEVLDSFGNTIRWSIFVLEGVSDAFVESKVHSILDNYFGDNSFVVADE